MEQFLLEKYLENPNCEVVTRNGRPVRIVCWDSPNNVFPIVGFVDNKPEIFTWDCFGYCREGHIENENDLFFADEEDGLTEFEKELQIIISEASHWTSDDGSMSTYCHFGDKEIKKISGKILDLARKEIEKDVYDNGYRMGYDIGKQDALKDLPMWKKSGDNLPYPYIGGLSQKFLVKNGYYIKISDLETLPKEE